MVLNVSSSVAPWVNAFTASVMAPMAANEIIPVAVHTLWRMGVMKIAAMAITTARIAYKNITSLVIGSNSS
jgi:hypothetical protein